MGYDFPLYVCFEGEWLPIRAGKLAAIAQPARTVPAGERQTCDADLSKFACGDLLPGSYGLLIQFREDVESPQMLCAFACFAAE